MYIFIVFLEKPIHITNMKYFFSCRFYRSCFHV